MKSNIITTAIALLLVAAFSGCAATPPAAPKFGQAPIALVDTTRIQDIVVNDIVSRYHDLKASELKLKSINCVFSADGIGHVEVTYVIPKSIALVDRGTPTMPMVFTKIGNIIVSLSMSGEIKNVFRGSTEDFTSTNTIKKPNQAPEPTPTAVTPPAGQEARQP
jgi:hypothetical protein